ncbi:hypothetical protein C5167_047854 [Papaver somniferum]|uniref:Uncharacterized protein n=1 Tax=Papaver somniferum TaxID=3469 RepID=A0A4Y7LK45_PAPSO|nr:hypothetical protein C5167_047854 [Papaver somniferum]
MLHVLCALVGKEEDIQEKRQVPIQVWVYLKKIPVACNLEEITFGFFVISSQLLSERPKILRH